MDKNKSRQRLRESVYAGLIKKPKKCSRCGKSLPSPKIHGHHHKGYSRWWDVIWVCMKCHDEIEPAKKIFGDRNGMRKNPEKSNCVLNNPNKKLTDDKVREIKNLLSGGVKAKKIAPMFDVTYENIWAIKTGKTWSHI